MKRPRRRIEKKSHAKPPVAVQHSEIQIVAVQRGSRSRHFAPIQTRACVAGKFHRCILKHIADEITHAREGRLARIWMKMNALVDPIIIEKLFALPGIGSYGIDAITNRDYPQVLGFILISALVFQLANLCVDLVYCFLDPRIRYGKAEA